MGADHQEGRHLRRLIEPPQTAVPQPAAMRAAAAHFGSCLSGAITYFAAPPCDFTTVSADAIRLDTSARLAGTMSVLPVFARLPNAST